MHRAEFIRQAASRLPQRVQRYLKLMASQASVIIPKQLLRNGLRITHGPHLTVALIPSFELNRSRTRCDRHSLKLHFWPKFFHSEAKCRLYVREFRFHMECAKGCKAIMHWIFKDDYFVYQYPRLSVDEVLWLRTLTAN